jgi:hypothetical protein
MAILPLIVAVAVALWVASLAPRPFRADPEPRVPHG